MNNVFNDYKVTKEIYNNLSSKTNACIIENLQGEHYIGRINTMSVNLENVERITFIKDGKEYEFVKC